jgi:hypothetical protein
LISYSSAAVINPGTGSKALNANSVGLFVSGWH